MEAIAAASSVAGLLGLAGSCLSAAQSLFKLYQDIRAASKTVEIFIKDINGLIRTLHDVQGQLQTIERNSSLEFHDLHLTTLRLQLNDCNGDMQSWLATAEKYRPSTSSGGKKWFKKFWTAINEDSVKNVSTEIRARRSEIDSALAVLGR